MRLAWNDTLNTVVMTMSYGTELCWPCNTWSRTKTNGMSIKSNIFDCINEYVAQMPAGKILILEDYYSAIYELLSNNSRVQEVNSYLKPMITSILELFDWNVFKLWCIIHGKMELQIGIKDELGDKDTQGLTYFTKDYEDLAIFSVLLKLIMPIWGMYAYIMKNTLSTLSIPINAVELIRNNYIENNPAFIKLEHYVDSFADNRVKTRGFSLLNNIGSEEINEHLLSMGLWKKIIIFNVRETNTSIVRNLFRILIDKADKVNSGGPNPKKLVDDGTTPDITFCDRYKITQRVSPAVSVITDYYIQTYTDVALSIDPTISVNTVINIRNNIPNGLKLSGLHITIMSLVCKRVLYGRNLQLNNYLPLLNICAVTSALLLHWGFPAISKILIQIPSERDIYSTKAGGNQTYLQLKDDIKIVLNSIYSFSTTITKSGIYHPGLRLIDTVVKEVNSSLWEIPDYELSNIRNEIAELLIKQEF